MACINCNAEVTGNFCANCGQKTMVKRLTFREGWNDFWARIYGFDGLFPRTLRDVTLRPGLAARKFIEGNRATYYGPVGYFFLMATLMYLVASLLNVDLIEFLKANADTGLQPAPKKGTGMDQVMTDVFKQISDNMKLISFVFILVQAFASRYLFFRKTGYNYIEHLVLPLYVQGHVYWLSILSIVFSALFGFFIPNWIGIVVSLLYTCYAYANFFNQQSFVKGFFKALALYIIVQLIFIIIVAVVFVVMMFLDPELIELMKPSNNK